MRTVVLRRTVIAPLLFIIWAGDFASAAGSPGTFYKKNTVRNVFEGKVELETSPEIQHFPVRRVRLVPKTPPDKAPLKEESAPPPSSKSEPATAQGGALSVRDTLVSEYGDPALDPEIPVVKDAPTPFRAMMASLDAGEDELAFQYARQYVRHVRNLQERGNRVVGLIGQGLEREGLLEPGSWQSAPQYARDRNLLEQDQNKIASNNSNSKLDEKTRALLEKATAAEDATLVPKETMPPNVVEFDEDLEREKVRVSLIGKVPVDPQGKVDIYFFFRPQDSKSVEMAKELQFLYAATKDDPNVNLMAVTLDVVSNGTLEKFRNHTTATYPIRNDGKLSKIFGVKDSPTTMFVAQSSGKARQELGARKFYYLEELLRAMKGGR